MTFWGGRETTADTNLHTCKDSNSNCKTSRMSVVAVAVYMALTVL